MSSELLDAPYRETADSTALLLFLIHESTSARSLYFTFPPDHPFDGGGSPICFANPVQKSMLYSAAAGPGSVCPSSWAMTESVIDRPGSAWDHQPSDRYSAASLLACPSVAASLIFGENTPPLRPIALPIVA